jgi:tripartite-type tricarboxylate transporter receptor subunit TctC
VTLKSATRLIGTLLVALVCLGDLSYAQNYPDRPIRLIVPFGAGGITDLTARVVAQELSKQLGQTVVAENRPGAGGAIAAGQVARAAPDGYTLMIITNGMVAVAPLFQRQLPYDPLNDFEYISMIANTPLVFVTSSDSAFETLSDLVKAASTEPATVSFSSSGLGTSIHQAMALLNKSTGASMLHVPYKSGAEAAMAVLSGTVVATAVETVVVGPMIASGKLRALGLTAAQRVPSLPDVPTVKETIGTELEAGSLSGLVAPKGTPSQILARLEAAIHVAVRSELAADRIYSQGSQPMPEGSAVYREKMLEEQEKWRHVFAEQIKQ